jgi:hypothetical protein
MTRQPIRRPGLAALLAVSVFAAILPGTVGAQAPLYPTGYVYRDTAGEPLPFQDKETILEALRTGKIVEREPMTRGIAKNDKLVLEYEGVRIKAVLRLIDVMEREKTGSQRMVVKFRDSHIFEAAAYELSELLGIGRVPPTVERVVEGVRGTVQIWMQGTEPEDIMLEKGRLNPPDTSDWWEQKRVMLVFDALIANIDRNQGNLLIDDAWNLWFIDHTRAFRDTSALLDIQELKTCERKLLQALEETDEDEIRSALEPLLTSKEIGKLVLRRNKLIKHFDKQIKKRGESAVLYTLDP